MVEADLGLAAAVQVIDRYALAGEGDGAGVDRERLEHGAVEVPHLDDKLVARA
jgi:hypothetical protein